jgi:uncharacterized membrane protein (DUF106 family)
MVDYLFGITWLTPLIFTLILSLITSLISQLCFKFIVNNKFIKESMAEMKELQQKLLKMSTSDAEYEALQSRLLDLNMKAMTEQLKPSLITMIPFFLLFAYAKSVIPMDQTLIYFGFELPLIGAGFEFFGVYFFSSMIFSTILRKILNR